MKIQHGTSKENPNRHFGSTSHISRGSDIEDILPSHFAPWRICAMTRHEFPHFGPRSCTALRPSMRPGTALALTPQVIQISQVGEGRETKSENQPQGQVWQRLRRSKVISRSVSISPPGGAKNRVEVSFWECCWIWDLLRSFKGFWGHCMIFDHIHR